VSYKTLVTGGAGFIGSHIVDKLISLGNEVVVIDNESSTVAHEFFKNPKASYHKQDIADYDSIRDLFDCVDYVFHLAAESRIQNTINNPLKCIRSNAYGTAVVLQCSREAGVKKVIYSSTSSAYGLKNQPPLIEDMTEDCLNPYSVAKVSGEKLCKVYNDLYGLKTIIFRYFNIYGPREPLKGPYAPVVGLFLRQFKNNESLTIVGDGLQRRDFTHVDDAVSANILAMEYNNDLYHGTVFNVGTGKNHSVLELAEMISGNLKFLDPRPAEARETLADNTKICREFGWRPTKSIEEYIKENLRPPIQNPVLDPKLQAIWL
jgi:UDP-glucose 4-epimerase